MKPFGPPESGDLEEFEAQIHKRIRELQDRHRLELYPLIKILSDINACKPPQPIMLDLGRMSELDRKAWLDRMQQMGVIDK